MTAFQAGAAAVCITPQVGIALAGYSGRQGGSVGIHDDLYGKALVFDDGHTASAIITLDLIGLDDASIAQVRALVAAQTPIPAAHVLVAASHTHSGPMPAVAENPYQRFASYSWTPDADWTQTLLKLLAGAVVAAWHNRRPAKLALGEGELEGLAYNRRRYGEGGMPVDPAVAVMLLIDMQDQPFAVLYNYACHPVTLRENNVLISADYPGVASRLIQETFPGVVALFLNGCCGDLDPLHRFWGSYEGSRQAGLMLGGEVVQTVARLCAEHDFVLDPGLYALARRIVVPTMPIPSRVAAAELVQEMEVFLAELRKRESSSGGLLFPKGEPWHSMIPERHPTVGLAEFYLHWAQQLQSLADAETVPAPLTAEVQVLGIGLAALFGLPGEIFVDLGLQIKARLAGHRVFVASYANGNVGYVPTRSAFDEGGYEVKVAQRARLIPLSPGAGELMVEGALALLS